MDEEVIEEIFAEEDLNVKETADSFYINVLQWPSIVFQLLTDYGWFVVAICILVYFLWNKYKPSLLVWRECSSNAREPAMSPQDTEVFIARQRAMEVARLRMQEEINQLSIIEKEKIKEREEEKRRQKIEQWEKMQLGRSSGRKLNDEGPSTSADSAFKKKEGKSLRGDYNPLTGSSGGACFRPARRGMGGGGG